MENKNNLSQGLSEKSEIFQYMFEKDHTVIWALPLAPKQAKHKIQETKRNITQAMAEDLVNQMSIVLSQCGCHLSKGSKHLHVPAIWSSCRISQHLLCSTTLYLVQSFIYSPTDALVSCLKKYQDLC